MSTATWENRRLCDDGSCTGLIGGDGVCSVCGRATKFWGDERRRGMQDDDSDGDGAAAGASGDAAMGAAGDDVDERELCVDGSCTGLQDADGRCNVCGKVDPEAIGRGRARSSAAAAAATTEAGTGTGTGTDSRAGADANDDDDRRLCPDGGCTGLIGADGACKVCGRRAEA